MGAALAILAGFFVAFFFWYLSIYAGTTDVAYNVDSKGVWDGGEVTAIETSEMQCPQYHRVPGESLLCRPRRQVLEGVFRC